MTTLSDWLAAPARGDDLAARRAVHAPLWLAAVPFLLFITLPVAALLLSTSPGGAWENLQRPDVALAVRLSIGTSLTATLLSIAFGTPVAMLMAWRTFPLKRVLDTFIDLPTVLPPAVAGVALLLAFGRRGLLGSTLDTLGIDIAFTTAAVIIAQTFIASPFYVKSAIVGFASIEREMLEAAALDGADRWQLFRFVLAPLAWTALAGGAVLTFARALGEFGATIIFAGNFPGRTQTMPLAIYLGFELHLDVALTLSLILVSFAFAALIIIKTFLRQS
ncbi:MAG: molybdate ABC transporter permease subunit [Chloroflexi bacterium]|nr:molybdate ABC transporter permease subunit [Chloroflexota bacterium]